jgi:hypothetical protein
MRKHPGIVSRCKPSFDSLEERALLSGGYAPAPGPGQMLESPPPPAGHSGSMSLGYPGFDGAHSSPSSWAQSPDGSWPSEQAGTTESQPDWNTPSQPAGGSQYQAGAGPAIPSIFFPQLRLYSAPSPENPSSSGSEPGSFAPALVNGQSPTTSPGPASPISLDAPAVGDAANLGGVTVGAGKDAGQEPGGVSNGPSGPAVTSPPAQILSLLDRDIVVAARLVSQGEVSTAGIPLPAAGSGQGSVTANGYPGTATTSRGALISAAHALTNPADGSNDDWPRPKSADLIASALPFDRAALDRAIDQFFQQFDELNLGNPAGQRPANIVLYTLALASTFAALDVVRRRWRLTTTGKYMRVRHSLATAGHVGFPELPGSWSSRLP